MIIFFQLKQKNILSPRIFIHMLHCFSLVSGIIYPNSHRLFCPGLYLTQDNFGNVTSLIYFWIKSLIRFIFMDRNRMQGNYILR